ncbi:MAG: hypothetical protein KAI26_04455 [Nanoarchaeota archaeon]|nr:hypothetical protein [Nanoarchaeota archaeon]
MIKTAAELERDIQILHEIETKWGDTIDLEKFRKTYNIDYKGWLFGVYSYRDIHGGIISKNGKKYARVVVAKIPKICQQIRQEHNQKANIEELRKQRTRKIKGDKFTIGKSITYLGAFVSLILILNFFGFSEFSDIFNKNEAEISLDCMDTFNSDTVYNGVQISNTGNIDLKDIRIRILTNSNKSETCFISQFPIELKKLNRISFDWYPTSYPYTYEAEFDQELIEREVKFWIHCEKDSTFTVKVFVEGMDKKEITC